MDHVAWAVGGGIAIVGLVIVVYILLELAADMRRD